MQRYGVRDVERLLHLSRGTIRALVEAGFVSPQRGPRNAWRFSFQDLIVLRTAQTLAAARVPRRRILHALQELRRRLPGEMPLSGLSIGAVADHVVVREGTRRWNAASGQYLLAFDGDPAAGTLRVFEPAPRGAAQPPSSALTDAQERETHDPMTDPVRAMHAYERAISAQPDRVDARINLGHLLHETGHLAQAEHVYRAALSACGPHPLVLYNLGVLLDDMDRKLEAIAAYEAALREDPRFADCHYNLALLLEEAGDARRAIRHMAQYRRLSEPAR